MSISIALSLFIIMFLFLSPLAISQTQQQSTATATVCIIRSGIGGSSLAYFLRNYSDESNSFNRMLERNNIVDGRMATINITENTFEVGALILHPKNMHTVNFTKQFYLTVKEPSSYDDSSFRIWDGKKFVFKTLDSSFCSKLPFVDKIVSLAN